jgi:uncharacterized protein YxeA
MKRILFALCVIATLTVSSFLLFKQLAGASFEISIKTTNANSQSSRAEEIPNTPRSGRIIGALIFTISIFSGIIITAKEIRNRKKEAERNYIQHDGSYSPLL